MRFQPATEAEVSERGLLPKGEYAFEVLEATDTTSKSGNEMMKVKIAIEHNDSRYGVFDYLVGTEGMAYKVRHFADAIGLIDQYEKGELPAELCIGLAGKCKIDIQPAKDGYDAKNVVKDYIKRGENVAPLVANKKPITRDDMDDDLPF